MRKKGLFLAGILLTLATLSLAFAANTTVTYADQTTITDSGTFGDSITWTLDSEGTLVLSGSGKTPDCSSLQPDGSTIIYQPAWHETEGNVVKHIIIEPGITGLGAENFHFEYDCESILFPATLTDLDTVIASALPVQNIYVAEENPNYSSKDGILFDKTGTQLLRYPAGREVTFFRIPDGVQTIGSYAFYRSIYLRYIQLPSGLTTIMDHAFQYSYFGTMILPETLTTIGDGAFEEASVTKLYFLGDAPDFLASTDTQTYTTFQNGRYNYSLSCYYFDNNSTWTDSVKKEYGGAPNWQALPAENILYHNAEGDSTAIIRFGSCGEHVWWKLEDDILSIFGSGDMQDWYTTEYSGFSLPPWNNGGTSTFQKVVVSPGVTSIGDLAFWNCLKVRQVELPDTLRRIGKQAFSLTALTELVIPDSVTEIGEIAFRYCKSLRSITLPKNLTGLADQTFESCDQLEQISIPQKVTYLGEDVFYGCAKLKEIVLPDSITEIGKRSFEVCNSLTTVILPSHLTAIADSLFESDAQLAVLTIPDTVKEIGANAFNGCESLTEISIPDSVASIGDYAFMGCKNLKDVHFGQNLEVICASAFQSCHNIIELTLPDQLGYIQEAAFAYCDNLTTVTFNKNLKFIGDSAFGWCTNLASIALPDSTQTISHWAFIQCDSMTSVTFGYLLREIGSRAFYDCNNLTEIYFTNDAPACVMDDDGIYDAFVRDYATAYYPEDNSTWTEEERANYGSNIKWQVWAPHTTELSTCSVSLPQDTYTYTGIPIYPEVLVKDGDVILRNGTDYTLAYYDNTAVGQGSIVIAGKNDYRGSIELTFEIVKACVSLRFPQTELTVERGAYVSNELQITYDSKCQDDARILYSSSNENVATVDSGGAVRILGYGTTTISAKVSNLDSFEEASASYILTVNKDVWDISTWQASLDQTSFVYDGTEKCPSVTEVTNGSHWLTEDHFKVEYRNNIEPGTATVIVKGIGEREDEIITGTIELPFTITDSVQDDGNDNPDKPAEENPDKPSEATPDKPSGEKTAQPQNNEKPKAVQKNNTIVAAGRNLTGSAKAQTFKLNAKNSGNTKMSYASNNKNVTIASNGTVKIRANFIGKATITIKAAANKSYKAATKKVTITVKPAQVKLSAVKNKKTKRLAVTWKKNTTATGYEIQYSTNKKFSSATNKLQVKGAKKVSATLRSLKKGKTYYVRIRCYKTVSGAKYYSAWSTAKKVKITK